MCCDRTDNIDRFVSSASLSAFMFASTWLTVLLAIPSFVSSTSEFGPNRDTIPIRLVAKRFCEVICTCSLCLLLLFIGRRDWRATQETTNAPFYFCCVFSQPWYHTVADERRYAYDLGRRKNGFGPRLIVIQYCEATYLPNGSAKERLMTLP